METINHRNSAGGSNRRTFLKHAAGWGGAALLPGAPTAFAARTNSGWRRQIGLELYTVRTLLAKDFQGTLAKVAEMGYREVEPVGYGGLDAKQFRALLDRYKLTAPSTHTSATEGPDLEKELAEHQAMGFRYTQIRAAGGRPQQARPAQGAAAAKGGARPPRQERPAPTVESVKHSAEQYNRQGAAARKFGMKVLIHNHAGEFNRLENSDLTHYDILLAETDPAVVAMQLDIGWATIAGQDVPGMFAKHPGRYELWHVKDVTGLKSIDTSLPPGQRKAKFVPIGQGEIDYGKLFAQAQRAGLKHFVIEQDNAGQDGGDALAHARANYQGLVKVLS